MSAELLVIFVVTLVVFGPNKLPMLATHLGLLVRIINQYKKQTALLWQEQLCALKLLENQGKATEADREYARLTKEVADQDPII